MSFLDRIQLTWRYTLDLVRYCTAELRHDRAAEMAAALTYRTIFSLVPVCVLALLVFNAFGGFQSVGSKAQSQVYQYLGLTNLTLPPENPGDDGDKTTTHAAESQQQLRAKVDEIISSLTQQVAKLNFSGIGVVGFALLIWAALALVITVENCFNRIYDAPTGRPWRYRIPIYWAIITLGPVLFFVSLYLSLVILGWVDKLSLGVLRFLFGQLTHVTAFLASWVLLFLLYTLLPNVRVERRPALLASFVTAGLYELGKTGFGLYVSKAVPYSKVYGSLGLIPLFLFWVYLTWLIVLFGLELTYAMQAMKGRRFKHLGSRRGRDHSSDPQLIFPILARIGQAFSIGRTISATDLAAELSLPVLVVTDLTQKLEKAGWVHRVQNGKDGESTLSLSLPPEKIPVARLLELSQSLTLGSDKNKSRASWAWLEKLHQVQCTAAGAATLATVLAEE